MFMLLAVAPPDGSANGTGDMVGQLKGVVVEYAPRVLGALLFVIVAYFLIKLILKGSRSGLKSSSVDATLHNFILGTFKILLWMIVVLIVFLILKIPVSPLAAVLGSVGLAFSLALRDNISNITGGLSILINRPFIKGDHIEVKGVAGKVWDIDLFYTRLVTEEGKVIYLPNSDMAKAQITNSTLSVMRIEAELDRYYSTVVPLPPKKLPLKGEFRDDDGTGLDDRIDELRARREEAERKHRERLTAVELKPVAKPHGDKSTTRLQDEDLVPDKDYSDGDLIMAARSKVEISSNPYASDTVGGGER